MGTLNNGLKVTLALIVAGAIGATAAIGTLALTGQHITNSPPPEIIDGCRSFIAAYKDADALAQAERKGHLDTDYADGGPNAASVWQARHQAKLEAAALKVQDLSRQPGEWSSVAWALVNAATVMKPQSLSGLVDQEIAISSAQAACVGR